MPPTSCSRATGRASWSGSGSGPTTCLARNPRLVYARMTGWGQDGPLAPRAGHDIDYLALTGALAAIGPRDGDPLPPLNLVGDYGGGSMLLLVGVLAALVERVGQRPGAGRRRGHGRRRDVAARPDVRAVRRGPVGAAARDEPPRRRLALLHDLPLRGRPLRGGRRARGAVLARAAPRPGARPRRVASARTTPSSGTSCGSSWRRRSCAARATSGWRSSRAPTPA